MMGVMQHHDAVTGTAKQAVTFDYQQRLAQGFKECEIVMNAAYKEMARKEGGPVHVPEQQFCRMLNVTECHISETSPKFVVTTYNPLVRPVDKFIRLPIIVPGYDVIAPNGEKLVTQVHGLSIDKK
jgi:lysosomal alpha-mannosidase